MILTKSIQDTLESLPEESDVISLEGDVVHSWEETSQKIQKALEEPTETIPEKTFVHEYSNEEIAALKEDIRNELTNSDKKELDISQEAIELFVLWYRLKGGFNTAAHNVIILYFFECFVQEWKKWEVVEKNLEEIAAATSLSKYRVRDVMGDINRRLRYDSNYKLLESTAKGRTKYYSIAEK